MVILGVWDGHDSGAAIVRDGKIAVAANEERFTRRKLEICFPFNSIRFCLESLGLRPDDITNVAAASSDFSNTLTRAFPKIKEDYYPVRRKIIQPNIFSPINRILLNNLGRMRQNVLFRKISRSAIRKNLAGMGFKSDIRVHIVEHHAAHAASAYYCSGFRKAVCVTMDALGDGISATVNTCDSSGISRISEMKTKDSLGLLYQEATQLLGMRILEDEGKVMSLADYSGMRALGPDVHVNPIMGYYEVHGARIKARKGMEGRWHALKKLKRTNDIADFAWMVQDATEKSMAGLFSNAVSESGISDACWSGGVSSNVKANMRIFGLEGLRKGFVFPHMGDGGLAAGAALQVSADLYDTKTYQLEHVFLGPGYDDDAILRQLRGFGDRLEFEKTDDPAGYAAEMLNENKIIYWFNGRMEYGPRALGARSILARPDVAGNRDRLNSIIKKRDAFQPFCPSILESDAGRYLEDYRSANRFMTTAFRVKEGSIDAFSAVISRDGTARPQIVDTAAGDYHALLSKFKKMSGIGALLNTSFNLHGEPIVCSPDDAVRTLLRTEGACLMIGSYMVRKIR